MKNFVERRSRTLFAALMLAVGWTAAANAQTNTPTPAAPSAQAPPSAAPPPAAPAAPAPSPKTSAPTTDTAPKPAAPDTKTPPPTSATPPTPAPPPVPTTITPGTPGATTLAPTGKRNPTEIEPNASPTTPETTTTETVDVKARPVAMLSGDSSYDDAFKSIKASLDTVKQAMDKAGLKPTGRPITIFSAPDEKGFKYQAAVPVSAKPNGKTDLGSKTDLGNGVTFADTPAGKALKFQHRGAYEDIDSTYDVITAYLDAKGLQVDNPYIEEYLTDLTTADDPNLQVDIYVFIK